MAPRGVRYFCLDPGRGAGAICHKGAEMDQRERKAALARAIDQFMTLDLTGLGIIEPLGRAVARRQPGPMCLGAARLILETLETRPGPVVIATGFPMGGGLAETDGPVGAAFLARAVGVALGRPAVILSDACWEPVIRGACVGAGLTPLPLPPEGVKEVPYLRAVHLALLPRREQPDPRAAEELLAALEPALLMAVERPGKNRRGAYHGLNGRPLPGWLIQVEDLLELARGRGAPLLAIGDGGNELGMGLVEEDLGGFLPAARDCGCGCGGGSAAVAAADHLVAACVSNWGTCGVVAALALELGRPEVLHRPEDEVRAIELCAAAGGLDGASVSPVPAVDGIPAREWHGMLASLRGILRRGLGLEQDWRQG